MNQKPSMLFPYEEPAWTAYEHRPNRPTGNPYRSAEDRKWLLIDATDLVTGRLAQEIAKILMGKHRVDYTPNTLNGDSVIVVNADKVRFTGRKYQEKVYYRHTGYPGGLKSRTAKEVLNGKRPQRVIEDAVWGMLPDNKLRAEALRRLRVYAGPDHPHGAQQPIIHDFASLNRKNAVRPQIMPDSRSDKDLVDAVRAEISSAAAETQRALKHDITESNNALRGEIRKEFRESTEALKTEFHEAVGRVEQEQKRTNKLLEALIAKLP